MNVSDVLLKVSLYSRIPTEGNPEVLTRAILMFDGAIDTHCPDCEQTATFRGIRSEGTNHALNVERLGGGKQFSKTFFDKSLVCTRKGHVLCFYFAVRQDKIIKVGQFPSMADLQKPETEKYLKVLGKERLAELNRAIGLAAHGVGVGSYVYLRRIFESLVEEAHVQAAKGAAWDEALYQQARMSEKIALLKGELPSFLVENPKLYGILSKGIHDLTESDCLANFEALKLAIMVILDEKLIASERMLQAAAAKKALDRI